MYKFLIFVALFYVIVSIVVHFLKKSPSASAEKEKKIFGYGRKEYFLTQPESACYKHLVVLAGAEYFVFAQVSLGNLLDERQVRGQSFRGARSHIDRKSVDFLLCDKQNISPKLAIELDDWSHSRPDRIERDSEVERILQGAGIPLLRIRKIEELDVRLKPALV